jgi:hypothetical protein
MREAGMTRWLVSAAIAMLAAFAFATQAGAGSPDHFTDSVDYSGASSCAGFDDVFSGHLDISGITTFDKSGNPVTDVVHFSGWEKNWRSDAPDVGFTAKRHFTVIYDYATDTDKTVGMVFSATAPGVGLLFHDVGAVLFDDSAGEVIFVHGPHDVLEQGDAAFCNALLAIS